MPTVIIKELPWNRATVLNNAAFLGFLRNTLECLNSYSFYIAIVPNKVLLKIPT